VAEGGRKSGTYGRFRGQPAFDTTIAALGPGRHAVFTLDELCELGLSASAVHKRVAGGRLHRRYRGVYSLVPIPLLSRKGHWRAAVLACGPGAALSHVTAAALHGLRPTDARHIHVTIPCRSTRHHPGIKVHRSTGLTPADVTHVDNIPCTTVARTQLDIAEMISRRALERVFDQSEILELFDLDQIEDQLTRNPTRPGAKRVKDLLKEHYIGSTLTESELEEAFLALCRRIEIPPPQLQQWLMLPDGGPPIRADFLWRDQRVVVEVDGRKFHGTTQARPRDARRDQRLTIHEWRPIRTDNKQIFYRPDELEQTLRELVKR
jgi:Protein of unknown function (DUF559)